MCLDDGESETVVSVEGDVAGRDPDADLHPLAVAASVAQVEFLLHRHGGRDRARGARKRRHQPIAEMLDDHATVRGDCVAEHLVVNRSKGLGGILADA